MPTLPAACTDVHRLTNTGDVRPLTQGDTSGEVDGVGNPVGTVRPPDHLVWVLEAGSRSTEREGEPSTVVGEGEGHRPWRGS